LTRSQLIQALQETGPEARIVDVMIPAERVPACPPNATLDKVMEEMMSAGSRVAAIKENQNFLGLITLDDITELFQVIGAKLASASRNQPPGQPATSASGVGSAADA
jgi:CBS domain containing-hemolysin-like protein